MTAAHRFGAEAWEALFRASPVAQELTTGEAWCELTNAEYGVLYALTKDPRGVRITHLGQEVLLTQTGLTRLAARLVNKGPVERVPDSDDGRAIRLVLTDQGRYIQCRIAVIHTREITDTMTEHLCVQELLLLRDLCAKLVQQSPPTKP